MTSPTAKLVSPESALKIAHGINAVPVPKNGSISKKETRKEIKIANFTLKISIPINKISHMTPIILNCALKYPLNTFLKLSASIRHLSCIIFGVCFRPNSRIRFLSAMKKYDDSSVKMVEINAFGKFFAIFPA